MTLPIIFGGGMMVWDKSDVVMAKPMLQGELVIAVDFDGTITTQPDMGHKLELRPHCKETLQRLHEDGVRLILWTARNGSAFDEATTFLLREKMLHLFDSLNSQLPEIVRKYGSESRKVGADVYIDDKNVFCRGVDWVQIENYIYGEGDNS